MSAGSAEGGAAAATPLLVAGLRARALALPEAPALVAPDRRMGFAELWDLVLAGVARLESAGVAPGDRVLLSATNRLAVPIAYFAILARGAIAVVAASDTPAPELDEIVQRTGARLRLQDGAADCGIAIDSFLTAASGTRGTPAEPGASDGADILFTTGTTGRRKGVLHSHGSIAAVAANLVQAYALAPGDIVALPMPMSHTFTLSCVRMIALGGMALQIERGLVNPRLMVERMRMLGTAGIALVPAGLEFLRKFASQPFASLAGQLRVIEMAGAPISSVTREWAMSAFPDTRILHHYGLTEAPRAVLSDYHADRGLGNTAGRPAPGMTVRILGEGGLQLAPGEQGQIHLAGRIVMQGYWLDDGSLDRRSLSPQGFATGDVGHLDGGGRLFISGRGDDIINVGGKKVAPDEVEELLRLHPAVDDVCCTPAPDPILGHVVEAHVVRAAEVGADALAAWLEGQIEAWKVPRHFHWVSGVPRTASGKLQRGKLRRG